VATVCTGKSIEYSSIGTKCNGLTQLFIGISTAIDTWATCFDSYRVIFRPSKNTDPINKVVKCTVGSPVLTKIVTVTIWNHIQYIIVDNISTIYLYCFTEHFGMENIKFSIE